MTLRALYIDFNSYFASVEQQERPELRGKPVAVLPVMTDSTCCIAASYEAKRFGVKTGTNVGEAKRMVPGLICVQARHERYVEYHQALLKVIDSCIPVDEVRSIDEMACSLTGSWRQRDKAVRVARQIKQTIRREVGECLTSSIGVAPNTFLAKTAADMQKPDGLVVIEQSELPQALHGLALRDLCGIGPRMEARLKRAGIHTVAALCAADQAALRRAWGGVEGEHMHDLLRGLEVYAPPTERGSIGHSHVLPPELRNDRDARAVLHRLLQKAALRLRRMGYCAGGMGLSLRYSGGAGGWSEEARFLETQDTRELIQVLNALWSRRPQGAARPMYVGVTLVRLIPATEATPSLFAPTRPRGALQNAVDRINLRYGKHALYFGGAHGGHAASPLRIAFNRIPDLETER
jgi:DNA polymerase IV